MSYLKDKALELADMFGKLWAVVMLGILAALVLVVPPLLVLCWKIFAGCFKFIWAWGIAWLEICWGMVQLIFS
jgi:hypothetical protein